VTPENWMIAFVAALAIGAVLYGVIQGLRGKEPRNRPSVGQAVRSAFEPGGFLYERNEAVRPLMERRGLTFQYWVYRAPDGRPVAFWGQQLKQLGGPFRFLVTPLQEVYEGTIDGTRVTMGHVYAGDTDAREERMAAIVAPPDRTVPAFVAAPRRFARGGDRLSSPSHPALEKTHRVHGDAAVLSGSLLDVLARHDGWAFEGKDHALVIYRTAPPRDPSGFMTVEEIGRFVDDALRIAGLFG
jgi:hypothetical protein